MKTLYLVRHAKSSWKDLSLADIDRPLNKRGKQDAPNMAMYLAKKIDNPGIFICSPSRRTLDTANYFLDAFSYDKINLILENDLYHGDESNFHNVIERINENSESAILFGHNPGITDYVNELTNSRIVNIPTCGIVGINLKINRWKAINEINGKLLFYFFPEGINNEL